MPWTPPTPVDSPGLPWENEALSAANPRMQKRELGKAGRSPSIHRLGKRELGPHAFEEQMPARILKLIETETEKNKSYGVVNRLAELLESDPGTETAYLCDASTVQIAKLRGEGNHFCAYRNMQMLLRRPRSSEYTILQLQDMIEDAWEKGFNPHAYVETGGIRGTRKHVGTSEAEALFCSLSISNKAEVFAGKDAWHQLLNSVEAYFTVADKGATPSTHVRSTLLPPVFLQRPSHSMTIIGIERRTDGQRQLLVFDPAYQSPFSFAALRSLNHRSRFSRLFLYPYRRDVRYLKRYRNFEVLYLETAS